MISDLDDLKRAALRSWPNLGSSARLELHTLWVAAGEQLTTMNQLLDVARSNGRPVRGEQLYPVRTRLREIRERARALLEGR